MIIKLAWRNMFRKKKRTFLIMLTVILSVVVLQFFNGMMNAMSNDFFKDMLSSTGHIQIKHIKLLDYSSAMTPSEYPVADVTSLQKAVVKHPGVVRVNPFIQFGAFIIHEREHNHSRVDTDDKPQMPLLVTGIEYQDLEVHKRFRENLQKGSHFIENPGEIIMGYKIAYTLDIEVGDEVQLMTMRPDAGLYYQSFKVAGLYQTMVAEENQGTAIIGLQDARQMLAYGDEATYLAVVLDNQDKADAVSREFQSMLEKEIHITRKMQLPVDAVPAIQIPLENQDKQKTQNTKQEAIPCLIMSFSPDTLNYLATDHEALNRLIEQKDDSVWIISDDSALESHTDVQVVWSSDFGITTETWTISDSIPVADINLPSGTLLYISDHSLGQKVSEASVDPLLQMMKTEAIQSELISMGIDLDGLFSQSQKQLSNSQEAIKQFMTIARQQEIASESWTQFSHMMKELIDYQDQFIYYLFLMFAITVAAIIINNVLINVYERVREIGTLRAIGWSKLQVLALIEVEAIFVGIVGSLIGLVLGTLIVELVGINGIAYGEASEMFPGMSSVLYPSVDLYGSIRTFLLGVLLMIMVSIIPAAIAVRMRPVQALGYV